MWILLSSFSATSAQPGPPTAAESFWEFQEIGSTQWLTYVKPSIKVVDPTWCRSLCASHLEWLACSICAPCLGHQRCLVYVWDLKAYLLSGLRVLMLPGGLMLMKQIGEKSVQSSTQRYLKLSCSLVILNRREPYLSGHICSQAMQECGNGVIHQDIKRYTMV